MSAGPESPRNRGDDLSAGRLPQDGGSSSNTSGPSKPGKLGPRGVEKGTSPKAPSSGSSSHPPGKKDLSDRKVQQIDAKTKARIEKLAQELAQEYRRTPKTHGQNLDTLERQAKEFTQKWYLQYGNEYTNPKPVLLRQGTKHLADSLPLISYDEITEFFKTNQDNPSIKGIVDNVWSQFLEAAENIDTKPNAKIRNILDNLWFLNYKLAENEGLPKIFQSINQSLYKLFANQVGIRVYQNSKYGIPLPEPQKLYESVLNEINAQAYTASQEQLDPKTLGEEYLPKFETLIDYIETLRVDVYEATNPDDYAEHISRHIQETLLPLANKIYAQYSQQLSGSPYLANLQAILRHEENFWGLESLPNPLDPGPEALYLKYVVGAAEGGKEALELHPKYVSGKRKEKIEEIFRKNETAGPTERVIRLGGPSSPTSQQYHSGSEPPQGGAPIGGAKPSPQSFSSSSSSSSNVSSKPSSSVSPTETQDNPSSPLPVDKEEAKVSPSLPASKSRTTQGTSQSKAPKKKKRKPSSPGSAPAGAAGGSGRASGSSSAPEQDPSEPPLWTPNPILRSLYGVYAFVMKSFKKFFNWLERLLNYFRRKS